MALVVAVLLTLAEGLASFTLAGVHTVKEGLRTLRHEATPSFHVHDAELGWTCRRNAEFPGIWGKGINLRFNSQGLRGGRELRERPEEGKIRVLCSGDSFTFGLGVDDRDTWSSQLEALDDRLEVLDAGVMGYGVDQAYLRFRRDLASLRPDVHLFAFIYNDFERARSDRFNGYPKPLLRLKDDALVVANAPLPEPSGFEPYTRTLGSHLFELRFISLASRLLPAGAAAKRPEMVADVEFQQIIFAMFDSLRDLGGVAAIVDLPTLDDQKADPRRDGWRALLREQALERGLLWLDLVEDFRRLPPQESARLFLLEGERTDPYAARHYNEPGNRYVAGKIHQQLLSAGRFPSATRQP